MGLIFAGIGASLMAPDAQGAVEPVINAATFGVVVIMVIVTTLLTPPAIKWAMGRGAERLRSTTLQPYFRAIVEEPGNKCCGNSQINHLLSTRSHVSGCAPLFGAGIALVQDRAACKSLANKSVRREKALMNVMIFGLLFSAHSDAQLRKEPDT